MSMDRVAPYDTYSVSQAIKRKDLQVEKSATFFESHGSFFFLKKKKKEPPAELLACIN